jgi:HK97 gp10 family phage protein
MGVETSGFLELTAELQDLAYQLGEGGADTELHDLMRAAGQPVLEQAKANCKVISGTLQKSLTVVTKKSKDGRYKARIGAQKGSQGYYATFVEYGHGGPHPALPHPFLDPAYDVQKENAYGIIKTLLGAMVDMKLKK